jgi:hypothetical protein
MPIQTHATDRDRYLMCAADIVDDDRLSAKAKGVATYLLSKPPDWTIHVEEVASSFDDGPDTIRSALSELEDAGYVDREQLRGDDGRFAGTEYTVRDVPGGSSDGPDDGPDEPGAPTGPDRPTGNDATASPAPTPSGDSAPASPDKAYVTPSEGPDEDHRPKGSTDPKEPTGSDQRSQEREAPQATGPKEPVGSDHRSEWTFTDPFSTGSEADGEPDGSEEAQRSQEPVGPKGSTDPKEPTGSKGSTDPNQRSPAAPEGWATAPPDLTPEEAKQRAKALLPKQSRAKAAAVKAMIEKGYTTPDTAALAAKNRLSTPRTSINRSAIRGLYDSETDDYAPAEAWIRFLTALAVAQGQADHPVPYMQATLDRWAGRTSDEDGRPPTWKLARRAASPSTDPTEATASKPTGSDQRSPSTDSEPTTSVNDDATDDSSHQRVRPTSTGARRSDDLPGGRPNGDPWHPILDYLPDKKRRGLPDDLFDQLPRDILERLRDGEEVIENELYWAAAQGGY